MNCFPLDNREYTARMMGAFLGTRTRGVFCAEDNLRVTANGDYTLSVSPGLCWLSADKFWGVCGLVDTATILNVLPADGELNRVDAVCVRLDKNRNLAEVAVRQGAYGLNPAAPTPRRDTEYDELVLATVQVPAGATGISAANLRDTRLDEDLCGVMRDGVTGIPTGQLQAEYRRMLDDLKTELQGVEDGSAFMLRRDYEADYPTFLLKDQHETDEATAEMSGGALRIASLAARAGTSYDVRFVLPSGYTARNTAVIDGTKLISALPKKKTPYTRL